MDFKFITFGEYRCVCHCPGFIRISLFGFNLWWHKTTEVNPCYMVRTARFKLRIGKHHFAIRRQRATFTNAGDVTHTWTVD